MSHLRTLVTLNCWKVHFHVLSLLILNFSKWKLNWFIWFIICFIVDSMRELTSRCFCGFNLIENWTTFAMDYTINCGTSSMFSSFFSATSVASSNVSTYSCITCYRNSDKKPMVKYSNTYALIPTKISLVPSWPYALKHPWSLFCNVIVFSLYYFIDYIIPCFN
jgi:hypothetical protein